MTIYEPHETRAWSTRELDALIGEHVSVEVNYRPAASGNCTGAGVGSRGNRWIDFEDGGSAEWNADSDDARITIR